MVSIETRVISPEYAAFLLAGNTRNRPVSKNNVDFLALEMTEGRFKYNGDTIRIDTNMCLIDGQHRLHAIVKSATSQQMTIISGLEPEVFTTIDQGRKRTIGDILSTLHAVDGNYSGYSAAAKRLAIYNSETLMGKGRGINGRNDLILQCLEENKERLIEGMGYAYKASLSRITAPAYIAGAFAHYALEDVALARSFFDDLSHIQPESKTVAIIKERLKDNRMSRTRMVKTDEQALILKALRKYFDGQPIARLSYAPGEAVSYAKINKK